MSPQVRGPDSACLYTDSLFCDCLVPGSVRRSFVTHSARCVDVEPSRRDASVGVLNNIHVAGCAAPDR
ncbi:hypothetical protein W59_20933 [Rhodococcus opacus RKJ300 = JCM 13270]|uniref:Uncharacterized protein n=1 Tax=Rhodococcus opacus RKJ300 = JCM 13270 TaxID=1165867 RepID=I0WN90_RHOOP|nr:hypothetical protein W59_20933 [Rhodococcus opacus RKJ300 = JCM 13270]